MHWDEEVPKLTSADADGVSGSIFAGELLGKKALPPPPNSWAADPANEVAVWHLALKSGATITLPAALHGQAVNRQLYFIEGSQLTVGARRITEHSIVTLNAGVDTVVANPHADTSEVLVLQGRPIGEPVVQHGPFVMNTQAEIKQAFADFQRTQFGGTYNQRTTHALHPGVGL
jgi:hypothetical protein